MDVMRLKKRAANYSSELHISDSFELQVGKVNFNEYASNTTSSAI